MTVTVTMQTANPTGLTVGSTVTVAGVSVGTHNGVFIVATIPDSTHFTYTVTGSATATGTGGFASAGNIVSASESGTTVTIQTVANPSGLIVGDNVTVSAVKIGSSFTANGYDGSFVVTGIPDSTHFTYTAASSALGAGTGGTAAADTFECGMVDQGAATIPNDSGKILLAGGDFITFLGQSSNYSFIFDPATQTFAKTTGNLTTARELASLVAMDPALVTGALSGKLVSFGGIVSTGRRLPSQQRGNPCDHDQHRGGVRSGLADLERSRQHHGCEEGGPGDPDPDRPGRGPGDSARRRRCGSRHRTLDLRGGDRPEAGGNG